ncbi:MAG: VWA domain-containing protein [Spirochaetaceae bacterium]|nr:MAG: VWA domain-containing protein [Spirochaetaceae bacterium]
MSPAYPAVLWLLLGLIPVAGVLFVQFVRHREQVELVTGMWRKTDVANVLVVKWFFSSLLFLIALAAGILAIAEFSWGTAPVEEDRSGLDVVLVVDVSWSMLADDIRPSRLDRVREVIRGVIQEFPESRFGLVAFKGTALRLVPMTSDTLAVESVLDALSPTIIAAPGTDIGVGITAGLAAFPEGTDRHRAIIVLSDGENLHGTPFAPAMIAADRGIAVFAVGSGTLDGSTIRLPSGELLRDASGDVVISRLDPDTLRRIAELTGGPYVSLGDPDAFARIVGEMRAMYSRRVTEGFRLAPVRRYRLFLLIALVSLMVAMGVRAVRWRNIF